MSGLSRFWMLIMGFVLLVACTPQQPLPTLAPTPIPPTETPNPTATRTPTLTPTATQAIPRTESLDPATQSFIRVVNISQITDPLDVYIDGLNIASFLEYGQFTPSGGIVAGNYTLHVVPNGGRPGDGSLAQQPLSVGGQQALIVLVSGTLSAPQVRVLVEDVSPLRADESRLTVVNAIVDGLSFIMQLEVSATALTPILAPGDIASPVVLPAGENSLALLSGETLLKSFSERFRERRSYTFIVVGQGSDRESLDVISLDTPVSGITQVRAIHAAFGADVVDIYAGSIPLGTEMGYGVASSRQTLVAGVYDIAVYPTGADRTTTEPLIVEQLALNADDIFSFIFIGELTTFQIISLQENLSLTPLDEARVTMMHAVPTVPAIHIQAGELPPLVMRYGEVTEPFLMKATPTFFTWAVPEQGGIGEVLELGENIPLMPGINYLYLFTGKRLGFPLVYQESVGALVPTPDPNDFTPTPTQIPVTTLRAVNAAPGRFVDFRVDDVDFATALAYKNGSNPIIILDGDRIVTAHDQTTGELLGRTVVTVLSGVQYSVYVSPSSSLGYNMTVTEDVLPSASNDALYLRLVNTSSVDASFGLAYSDPVPGSDIVPTVDANATPSGDSSFVVDPYRRSLPFGTVPLIDNVFRASASDFLQTRRITGAKDLVIIDMYQMMMAAAVSNVVLEKNMYYDVVAFQQEGSTLVTTFMLPYPTAP